MGLQQVRLLELRAENVAGYDENGSRERGSRDIIDKLSAYLEG